jgi:folate-dependent phosphoribosylglycinamide formyltransferase PurN
MNLGVLASHEGTTLQSLLDAFAGGHIPGRVSVVVSNQCRVPVLRDDSVDDLKARVRAREKEFVVETLAGIAVGDIRLAAGAGYLRQHFERASPSSNREGLAHDSLQ